MENKIHVWNHQPTIATWLGDKMYDIFLLEKHEWIGKPEKKQCLFTRMQKSINAKASWRRDTTVVFTINLAKIVFHNDDTKFYETWL